MVGIGQTFFKVPISIQIFQPAPYRSKLLIKLSVGFLYPTLISIFPPTGDLHLEMTISKQSNFNHLKVQI